MTLKRFWKMCHLVFHKRRVSAFVGPSGSGKSTIFNLIERMYDIERGDIKYGNQSIFDIPLSKWRTKLVMLCNLIR